MGLTSDSTGIKAIDCGPVIKKRAEDEKIVALAGNPNVGKSTLFNSLTGMKQHTGNWPGKTVASALGYCGYAGMSYVLVDIPGTYSLMAHSAEEEVARDFICFGGNDAVVIVCDATCLERNLNLVLQTLEITEKAVVCINLMDEAKKKKIFIDLDAVSEKLGVPVVGTTARKKKSADKLMESLNEVISLNEKKDRFHIRYAEYIENAVRILQPTLEDKIKERIDLRWLSLRLLDNDLSLTEALNKFLGYDILSDEDINKALTEARRTLSEAGIGTDKLRDEIVSGLVRAAEDICRETVRFEKTDYNSKDRKIDMILTSRLTGFPIMILLVMFVFWLTITAANYPSRLLSDALFWLQDVLTGAFRAVSAPDWLHGALVLGVYRVLAWVVAVMLPPMAIFFPLFTLLEDSGYLPRVAFNLDKYFKKSGSCGKQALTMCMGFGCNAAGVIGCRIIDSPRERLIATITNSFVPCNGRFPALIAIITMFFTGVFIMPFQSLFSAVLLTCVIILGVFMTLSISKLLSVTVLKGLPSSFTLELPSYRKPQIGRVLVRSIFDRTLFVLGRAAMVAAPAGLVIWMMANITIGDTTLLLHCSGFLDPFGRLLGMDGVILMAFILGFPANEIVIPIVIMTYMASGSITEPDNLSELKRLLTDNGWTWITAISTMLFSLMHWPCSTTCLTVRKETQSLKWTALAFLVPTLTGIIICFIFASIARLFS
ncbi:MAG: ferrous iron transport protein B [Eubacteriales bacterium]|nr:ferrous iron transport protein B [Eubacteriales bacterium]